jgi:modification methylase
MRSDWMMPICNGKERLKKNGKKIHSTQKPEALLHRIILATTIKGHAIFDPFLGTGTTAVVAKKLGRKYFGIERDKKYFKAAVERINRAEVIEENYLDTIENNKSKPRIPFGSLVELGILKPGTVLFDPKKKFNAKIMVDGSIKCKESAGSIHKVAAKIMGTESFNGWTYWHCDINGATVVIDSLRQKFISEKTI